MLCSAIVALLWANSPWSEAYHHLWEIVLAIEIGDFVLSYSLHHWINEGLMAIFFFVVGLEIKREVLIGELSSPRKSALPIAGALGGMLVPAALYSVLNAGTVGAPGWGIPMATDIAFAIGVLAMLGSRIPLAIKIFLTALAIVDDIGAVLVIAVFYTAEISWYFLGLGAIFLAGLMSLNLVGTRRPLAYALFGIGLWFAFLQSGVHATIAGVLMAMTIPARSRISPRRMVIDGHQILDQLEAVSGEESERLRPNTEEQQSALHALEKAAERAETPMQRMESGLHSWVSFVIVPLFALANAGLVLDAGFLGAFSETTTTGIILGLVVGKPVGIALFSWIAVRLGLATLGRQVTWRHVWGAGMLGGIGFTMSLFIANLAFPAAEALELSKAGILSASLLAGTLGWFVLSGATQQPQRHRDSEKSR